MTRDVAAAAAATAAAAAAAAVAAASVAAAKAAAADTPHWTHQVGQLVMKIPQNVTKSHCRTTVFDCYGFVLKSVYTIYWFFSMRDLKTFCAFWGRLACGQQLTFGCRALHDFFVTGTGHFECYRFFVNICVEHLISFCYLLLQPCRVPLFLVSHSLQLEYGIY